MLTPVRQRQCFVACISRGNSHAIPPAEFSPQRYISLVLDMCLNLNGVLDDGKVVTHKTDQLRHTVTPCLLLKIKAQAQKCWRIVPKASSNQFCQFRKHLIPYFVIPFVKCSGFIVSVWCILDNMKTVAWNTNTPSQPIIYNLLLSSNHLLI